MEKKITTVREPARDIPVRASADILIVGGGPAGLMAAQAAAGEGLKVMLIESRGYLGGNLTIGLPILGFLGQKGNQIIEGLPQRFIDRLQERGAASGHRPCKLHVSLTIIDPEESKTLAQQLMEEAGVEVLMYVFCTDVIREGNEVKGVVIESKAGREAILARTVIDCTGDADVAFRAGVECRKGDAEGGMQPPTLMFSMRGVATQRLRDAIAEHPDIYDMDIMPAESFRNEKFITVGLRNQIAKALEDTDMVFITAGMGGGTGTGAAPVVAEVAHDLGILTVGIVTKPFSFEGKRKMGLAEQGIANLLMHVDSLIVIPNERLKMISQEKITLMNAFQAADNVLRQGVESISALINVPAFINLDFADVRSIMKDAGYAHMGVGSAKGAGKAENAAKAAISSPLLETSIAGAHGVIINITSSPDIGLEDVETAAGLITQSAHPDANIIWGTAFDENLSDEMRVTVVATGFDNKAADGLRSTLGTAAAGTAPGVTASAPSAVFSAEVNTPSAASGNASAAKPVEEENSDTSYYDDLLAILNKRR